MKKIKYICMLTLVMINSNTQAESLLDLKDCLFHGTIYETRRSITECSYNVEIPPANVPLDKVLDGSGQPVVPAEYKPHDPKCFSEATYSYEPSLGDPNL